MSKKIEYNDKLKRTIRQEERSRILKIFQEEIINFEQEIFEELNTHFIVTSDVKGTVMNEDRRRRFIAKLNRMKLSDERTS